MKRIITPLLLLLACTLCLTAKNSVTKSHQTTTIFVSPEGNDNALGNETSPLRTLNAALQKARQIRSSRCLADTLTIQLTEGTWNFSQPIHLKKEDSGTAASPLCIKGCGMDKTRLSAGIEVSGFTQADGGMWQLDISKWNPFGCDVPQLYVNGQRAICARTPNSLEFLKTGKAEEMIVDSTNKKIPNHIGLAITRVHIPAEGVEALQKVSPSPSSMRIAFLHAWDLTRRQVLSYNIADSTLYVTGKPQQPWNHIDRPQQAWDIDRISDCQFYFENDLSFLDVPGEYFYDSKKKLLYYIPREGENIATAKAIIPALPQILIVEGDDEGKVENINFEDISFCYTRYDYPFQGDEPSQGAARQNASIELNFAKRVNFNRCEITHTGNWAISYGNACFSNNVQSCYLHDLGGGGLHIGTMDIPKDEDKYLSRFNNFDNNILRSGGRVFPTAVGIMLFNASDNNITHNDISDFYYTGVSVGWVWGYAHSPAQRNIVNYNHIHHIGWAVLSDMGGVYTLGDARGSQVCYNHVHHIYSLGYGGWGLYTDEGTTGIRIENNLVHHCKSSGFHQHYGKDNLISNNIFVNNIRAQLEVTRKEPDHLPFTFTHNIIQYEQGNMYGINWHIVNFKSDENLYWNTRGEVTWNDTTFVKWQKQTGKDLHSIIADPQFKDIENGDYTIGNTEAAEKIHFKPFDYTKAGVYGDNEWKRLSQFDAATHALYQSIVDRKEQQFQEYQLRKQQKKK